MSEYDDVLGGMNLPTDSNPYDAAIDGVLSQKRVQQGGAAFVASKKNPDQYAETMRLSEQSGLPVDMVERNLPKVKEAEKRKSFDYDALIRDFPKTSLLTGDPIVAPMVMDDVDSLTGIEKFFRARADIERSFVGEALRTTGMGLQGVNALYNTYARGVDNVVRGALPESVSSALLAPRIPDALNPFASLDYVGGKIEGAGEKVGVPAERQNVATDIAGALGQVTTQAAVTILNPAVGTTMMFGQGAEMQERSVTDANALGTTEGDIAILAGAAATGITERIQLGVLLKRTPLFGRVVDKLPKQMQNKWLSQTVDIGGAGVSEAAQETVEGFLHDFIEYSLYNPDVEFLEGWEREAIAAGGAGAVFRGLVQGITKGRERIAEDAPAFQAEQEQAQLTALDELAKASKLAGRDPQRLEQFVANAAESSGAENIYISGERLNELYQSGQIDVAELSQVAPELQQQLPEALATGGDVIVPVEKMARLMATGQVDVLREDMRLSVDSMSAWEAKQDVEREEVSLDDTPQEDAPNENAIFENIYNQQIESGIAPNEARQVAELTQQRYLSRGELLGLDALDLFQAENISIQRRESPAAPVQIIPDAERKALNRRLKVKERPYIDEAVRLREAIRSGEALPVDYKAASPQSVKKALGLEKAPKRLGARILELGGISDGLTAQERGNVRSVGKSAKRYAAEELNAVFDGKPNLVSRYIKSEGRGLDDLATILKDEGYIQNAEPADLIALLETKGFDAYSQEIDMQLDELQSTNRSKEQELSALGVGKDADVAQIARALASFYDADIERAPVQEAVVDGDIPFFQSAPAVESDAFKRWFGDSKVVDADGKPLVVYHGTKADFEAFDLGMAKRGDGIWLATSRIANMFTGSENGGNVLPVYAKIENPFVYRVTDGEKLTTAKVIERAKEGGHDGVDMVVQSTGESVFIAFSPTQIKSVFNRGTFDPNDARILYQGDARGSIVMHNGQTIISLFENADASTILHELGHQWMFELSRDAKRDDAPQQLKDDLATLMEFTGETDYDAFNASVEAQEKLARGFEAYLMEGKAPSVELRGAFQRFSAWLTRIYKTVRGLNVTLNDDVRAVFDRMLATQEQIEAQRQIQEMKADPAILEMLTDAEKKDYIKRTERAKESAETELRNKLMREYERETKEWWKEESAKVAEGVETELRATNVYQLLDYLRNGQFLNAQYQPVEQEVIRMDKAALVREFGKERVEGLRARLATPLYVAKGGQPPEVTAELFGFSSAAEMMSKLEATPKLKDAVASEVDAIMKERHGDLLNDGSIVEAAIAATKNDQQGDLIASELSHLTRRTGQRRLNIAKEAIKQLAYDTVANKQARDVNKYMRYYYAGIKSAKEAGAALAKKDYEKAALAKRKQLLNHHLYIAHRDAAEEVEKGRKYLARMDNKRVRAGIRTEYMTQIDAVIEGVDFRKTLPSAQSQIGRTQRLLRARADAAALEAFVKQKEEEGDALAVDMRLTNPEGWKSYKDMSIDELRGLYDTVQNLEHLARMKDRLILNGRKRELEEVASEVVDTITENVKERRKVINSRRASERRGQFVQSAFGLVTKAQTFIEKMDGGKKIGTVYDALKRGLDEGTTERVRREQEAAQKIYEIMAKHYAKRTAKFGDSEYVLTLSNLRKNNIWVEELGATLSKEEVLAVALNQRNADNRKKLMDGRGWSQEQVDAVLRNMDARDVDFVNDIGDMIESLWPEIEAREQRKSGVIPEKVVGEDVQIPAGVIKGGYYVLKYDGNIDADTRAQEVKQAFNDIGSGRFARAQTRRSHTNSRVEGVVKPVRLDLGVFSQHINEVIADLTIGEAVENTNRILGHRSVKKAIVEHMGMESYQQLDLWLKDVAAGGVSSADGFSAIARNLRVSVSVGAMGLKLGTTLIQASGFAQSMVEIRPKWMLRGLSKFLTDNPMKAIEQVHSMSPYMRQRSTTLQRDMLDAIRATEGKGALTNIQKTYFWPMVKMQLMVDVPTFIGAYEKALSEGRTDADAVRYAEQAVENAQGSGVVNALSPIERGTTSQQNRFNEGIRLWTSFYSYFNTKLNLAMRQTRNTNLKNPVEVAKLASDYLMLFWVEALITEAIAGRIPDFEEDEDKDPFWYSVKLAAMNMMGTLPILREISAGMQGFDAAPAGTRGLGDVARGAVSLGKGVADIAEGEEVDVYRLTKASLNAANVFSPVKMPTGQIGVTLDAMRRADEGEDVPASDYVLRPPR